ncbi:MAG: helix-hairpin-helix domain-containing protein [Bacteroidota bacterium]
MIKLLKSLVRNHFGFSKAETNGMVLLFPVLLVTILSPYLFRLGLGQTNADLFFDENKAIEWKTELENSIIVQKPTKKRSTPFFKKPTKKPVVNKKFNFNPNKVTKKEIIELGFSKRVANNWDKFRTAGGKFHEYNDLKKIYSIDSVVLASLKNHIQFDPKPVEKVIPKVKPNKKKPFKIVFNESDLNKTGKDDLKKISGIGEKLSERIIKFRDRLGGFHSNQQLYEVYGLDSLVIQKINNHFHLGDTTIKRYRINEIGEEALATHPYIRRKYARIIVNYRLQHGRFESPQDLKKIHILNDSIVSKIAPYLLFE